MSFVCSSWGELSRCERLPKKIESEDFNVRQEGLKRQAYANRDIQLLLIVTTPLCLLFMFVWFPERFRKKLLKSRRWLSVTEKILRSSSFAIAKSALFRMKGWQRGWKLLLRTVKSFHSVKGKLCKQDSLHFNEEHGGALKCIFQQMDNCKRSWREAEK